MQRFVSVLGVAALPLPVGAANAQNWPAKQAQ
jgi:hypothetical protein